jgi:hypothetical protein
VCWGVRSLKKFKQPLSRKSLLLVLVLLLLLPTTGMYGDYVTLEIRINSSSWRRLHNTSVKRVVGGIYRTVGPFGNPYWWMQAVGCMQDGRPRTLTSLVGATVGHNIKTLCMYSCMSGSHSHSYSITLHYYIVYNEWILERIFLLSWQQTSVRSYIVGATQQSNVKKCCV